jgi:hypothetical protein
MRRTLLAIVIAVISALAFAQSTSPESLYEHGMDAISGAGPSHSDRDAISIFAAQLKPALWPLSSRSDYFFETGTVTAAAVKANRRLVRRPPTRAMLTQWMLGRSYFWPRHSARHERRSSG